MRSTNRSLNRRQVGRGGALLLGAIVLGAGACGVDDSREMYLGTQAGSSGSSGSVGSSGSSLSEAGVGSNMPATTGGEGGDTTNQGGVPSMSGSAGTGGTGGSSGSSTGGSAGHAGKGGSPGLCGNSKLDGDEECDDGNTKSGDGCSSACKNKCETCEKAFVNDPIFTGLGLDDARQTCYGLTDYAVGGPADGAPRAELCADTIDCARRTGCATLVGPRAGEDTSANKASLNACWCADSFQDPTTGLFTPDAAASCFVEATFRPGPCFAEFEAAAEADDINTLATNLFDTGLGVGRAAALLQLDSYGCRDQCLPESFNPQGVGGGGAGGGGGSAGSGGNAAGSGGTSGAGGTAGTSGTGGSAGTSGSGGSGGSSGTGGSGGSGGSSGSGGGGGGSSKCGNGTVDQGEECEPPSSQTCSDTCQTISNDDCVACEQIGACIAESDACLNFTGDERKRCFAVQQCITDTNCGDGAKTLTSCFCGSLSTADCIAAPNTGAGTPAGPCAKEIRAGMSLDGVTPATNNDVLVRYIDEGVPGGFAIARYNCDKVDPDCLTVCGF